MSATACRAVTLRPQPATQRCSRPVRPHPACAPCCPAALRHGPVTTSAITRRTRRAAAVAAASTTDAADATKAVTTKATSHKGTVVLTREKGKNDKLAAKLTALGLECVELPLIEHAAAADTARLPEVLAERVWDWVIVTSPEGAHVLLDGWEKAGKPELRMAVVGDATGAALGGNLGISFIPSKAMGKVLAEELPIAAPGEHVLYAGSALANNGMMDDLTARGFEVTRMSTYTTRMVEAVDAATLAKAVAADVVTFASPSTVKAWVKVATESAATRWPRAACIGKTSAVACDAANIAPCFFPEQPGMDGWVASVLDALDAPASSAPPLPAASKKTKAAASADSQEVNSRGYITFKF